MRKKLHWTQRPGGKAKARAAARKGHVTKKTRGKGRGSRAEAAVREAAATRPRMKTKIDVIVERYENLHEDLLGYLRDVKRYTEPDNVDASAVQHHGAQVLLYMRSEINKLKDTAAGIRELNNER